MSVSEAEQFFSTLPCLCWLCILHPPFILKVRGSQTDTACRGMTRSFVAAALEGHCERLYSEDFQYWPIGRKIQDMRIENPFA